MVGIKCEEGQECWESEKQGGKMEIPAIICTLVQVLGSYQSLDYLQAQQLSAACIPLLLVRLCCFGAVQSHETGII